jgi:hypothetical protein
MNKIAAADAKDVKADSAGSSSPTDNRNIHERLLDVMKDVDYVQKNKEITHGGGYKVVTHDAVTAKVRPVLVKHGIVYYPQNLSHVQNGNRTEVTLDIVFVNARDPSDKVAVPTFGYGIDAQDKGPGKSVSYAVKMALLKALGLETGEDADDGSNIDHKPDAKPEAAPERKKSIEGITKIKTAISEAVREVNACPDGDALIAFLPGISALCVQVCRDVEDYWIGPEKYSGLRGSIEKAGEELLIAAKVEKWLSKVEATARQQEAAE